MASTSMTPAFTACTRREAAGTFYAFSFLPDQHGRKNAAESVEQRPLWLMFPGIGVHRAHAASDLMRIPVFAASVERAAAALRAHDVDLLWLLTKAPESVFGDVMNIMVSIIAVQVALVDVLRAIGLHPDGFIGVSLGELGAAYADETLTVEQTILTAYWMARCLGECKLPIFSSAIVSLSWDEAEKILPPKINIMAVTNKHGLLVCGPTETVQNILTSFSSKGVGVKKLRDCLPYHTKHLDPALPSLRRCLRKVIPNPKPRSARWLSSLLEEDSHSEIAKLSSAEFFVHMISSLVDWFTPTQVKPKNAVLVEVSAWGKLLDHLNLPAPVTNVVLVRKESPDCAEHLFEACKKIYEALGKQPPVERLSAVFCCESKLIQ